MINQKQLIETVLTYTNEYEETVRDYISKRKSEETDAPEFDFNLMSIVDGAVALLVYEFFKKYIKEGYDYYLPSFTGIINLIKKKRLKSNLNAFLANYINEDEALLVTNRVLKILEENKHANKLSDRIGLPLNLIPLIYFLFKTVFFYFIIFMWTSLVVITTVHIMREYDEYGIELTIEEGLEEGFDVFLNGLIETIDYEGHLATIGYVSKNYGFQFLVSLIFTIILVFLIKKIFYFIKRARLKNITNSTDDLLSYNLRNSIYFESGININASILEAKTKNPFASKLQGGHIIGMPKKLLEKIPDKFVNFLTLHEYYHVISKDASITKYIKYAFIISGIFYSISLVITSFSYPLHEVSWSTPVFLLLLFISFAIIVRQNELRADYFAYKLTNDNQFEEYFSKTNSSFNIFYPSNSQRIRYLKNPMAMESSLFYSFSITILGISLMLVLPYSSMRVANFLICGLVTSHVFNLIKINSKQIIPVFKILLFTFISLIIWMLIEMSLSRVLGQNPISLESFKDEVIVSSYFFCSALLPCLISRYINLKWKIYLPVYWLFGIFYLVGIMDNIEYITLSHVFAHTLTCTIITIILSVIINYIKKKRNTVHNRVGG